MAKSAFLVALIVCGLLPAAEAHEGAPGAGAHEAGHVSPTYSRWHYWAPLLYRLRNEHKTPLMHTHPPDRFPGVPSPVLISSFPQPAIPAGELYLHTGHPYDPARPPAPAQPASSPTPK